MRAILTLAGRDIKSVVRDRFALFWIFAFPLMYALFFGSIFGDGGDGSRGRISLLVVDDDRSEASGELVETLADHESLRVPREGEAADAPVALSSLDEAREAVRLGRKTAYLRILAGYGDSPFAMFGGGEGTTLEVGLDPSRTAEAGILQGVLMQSMFSGMSSRFTDKDGLLAEIESGRDEVARASDLSSGQKAVLDTFMGALETFLADVDLDVLEEGTGGLAGGGDFVEVVDVTRDRGDEPQSPFEITFPSAMVWGLMSVSLTFAVVIVRERTQGTLLRLRIAPLTRAQILAGKALACFVLCQVVLVFLLAFGLLALDVRVQSPGLIVIAMASTGICFTGLMMTASVLGKTEQAVAGAAWGAMMPLAMVGGGMIPLIAMPSWLLALSDFSPFKWGIYSMEGAIWRGFDLEDMLAPCGILVGLGVAFFWLGVWVFGRTEG